MRNSTVEYENEHLNKILTIKHAQNTMKWVIIIRENGSGVKKKKT